MQAFIFLSFMLTFIIGLSAEAKINLRAIEADQKQIHETSNSANLNSFEIPPATVDALDLNAYSGQWYQVI
jgi:hypothetical protein